MSRAVGRLSRCERQIDLARTRRRASIAVTWPLLLEVYTVFRFAVDLLYMIFFSFYVKMEHILRKIEENTTRFISDNNKYNLLITYSKL